MEPCACKDARHKSKEECVFAPYLKPEKYANLLCKVFDISNMAKLLMDEVEPSQRQAFVDSLCFEAEARIRDPVMGCSGLIRILESRRQVIKLQLEIAKMELRGMLRTIHRRNRMAQRQNHHHPFIRSRL